MPCCVVARRSDGEPPRRVRVEDAPAARGRAAGHRGVGQGRALTVVAFVEGRRDSHRPRARVRWHARADACPRRRARAAHRHRARKVHRRGPAGQPAPATRRPRSAGAPGAPGPGGARPSCFKPAPGWAGTPVVVRARVTQRPAPSDAVLDPGSRIERPLYLTLSLYLTRSTRPPRLGVVLPLAKDVPWQRPTRWRWRPRARCGAGTRTRPSRHQRRPRQRAVLDARRATRCRLFLSAAFTHRDVGEADPQWLASGRPAWRRRSTGTYRTHPTRPGPGSSNGSSTRLRSKPARMTRSLTCWSGGSPPFTAGEWRASARLLASTNDGPGRSFSRVRQRPPNPPLDHSGQQPPHQPRVARTTSVDRPARRLASGYKAALTQSTNIIVTPSEVNDRHEWASLIFDPRLAGATAVPRTLNHLGLSWYRHRPGSASGTSW